MKIYILLGLTWIGRFFELFFLFICFYVLIVFIGMLIPSGGQSGDRDLTIYLRSNGVHTDLCLPMKTQSIDWEIIFPTSTFEDQSDYDWIGIGWGDKGFFLNTPTWAELKLSTALNAVFLPSGTAMHVEFLHLPARSERLKKIEVSWRQYDQLIQFITQSFALKNKRPELIPNKGYWGRDNFYEANGNYHLFNTCNVWTNEALKSANIRTAIFSALPEGNLRHL